MPETHIEMQPAARRRGRPPASSGSNTRLELVDVARPLFATHGFDGTSLQAVAAGAGLTPTAIYHYFGGKEALYQAVGKATIETVWSALRARVQHEETLCAQVDAFLSAADEVGHDTRGLSAFLIGVPIECRRNPIFVPLLELLSEAHSAVFDLMGQTGRRQGELPGFINDGDASDALRMLLLGWSYETHYQPAVRAQRAQSVRRTVQAWAHHAQ